MTTAALLVSLFASATPPTAATQTPQGWEVNKAHSGSVTWAAPKGWKLSGELPAAGAPSSLSIQGKAKGRAAGWLSVQALVSGNGTPEEVLAKRPAGITNVTTEDGWTCGEEPDSGAEVVCASKTELMTLVVALGGGSSRVLSEIGGVAALRKAAPLIHGVWPKGLPLPDADGNLPKTEWTQSGSSDGRVAWVPKGWVAAGGTDASEPTVMSFNATAGMGGFSVTALPGLGEVSSDQIPTAEGRIIDFLVSNAALSRADGWTCGEGREKSSGLPAIVCNKLTPKVSLYVSVRAEPAIFQTLGGVNAVRTAAERVKGFVY